MKLYREIKASDRLPDVPGYYNVRNTDDPYGRFIQIEYEGEKISGPGWKITLVWLEPIEITEEEISDIIYHEFKHGTSGAFTVSADRSAVTILSKLKGDAI